MKILASLLGELSLPGFLTCGLAAHVSAECPPVSNGETTYVFELPQQIEDGIGTSFTCLTTRNLKLLKLISNVALYS